ncbi:nitrate/nitrite transporter [Bacillus toyonensis]|uniref:nitrate/nitrite transporter n=1 Tax=Bacillus toyonensis TaxID=155322 RepID=UPI000BFD0986|nr:nitrate/nitrite transporter [Bacillus toyonensis]PHC39087.1 nitrate/nitrite transporter [Bacillus toyonensis]
MNKQKWQLSLQTSSLIVGFMVWVLISSLIPNIKKDIVLSDNEIALITAIPVILGSLMRILLGYWTNRFGARLNFVISFLILLFPVFYISIANSIIDLVIGGLVLGIGGATFSIGVTSLPKYYPKERHGFINGIYGAGNIGTAITSFAAPLLASSIGWITTVRLFIIPLLIVVILNFFLGDPLEPRDNNSLRKQIKAVYRNEKLWFLSFFYFITFGSFVAFTVYLPNFLVSNFQLTPVDAGIRTAIFITITTFLRPIGGLLGDKFNSLLILLFVFGGLTFSGVLLSFAPTIMLYTIGCLIVAFCAGIGNGVIFKLVPYYFSKQIGIANGIVSAMGGIGGFFPPLILSLVFNITGHYAIGFMALAQFSLASFVIIIWLYYLERLSLETKIIESVGQGLMVTDTKGIITKVNPAFTKLTGYQNEEIIGKKPNVLKSGLHDENFYHKMWENIRATGYWQGEIMNKRKNNEIYSEWLTISAIKNEAQEVKYYVGLFSDLTEQRK